MRRVIPFLLVIVLLLPTASALADSYQTANGQQTVEEMAMQLRSVGYGGPWDQSSILAAYARTTGGPVTAIAASPIASASSTRTKIIFIDGLELTPIAPSAKWSMLVGQLTGGAIGFGSDDLGLFSYADDPMGAGSSCQDPAISERQLVGLLGNIRASGRYDHVELIGHSFGGVLAVDTLIDNPGLVPFVDTSVAVDSPFGGITPWASFLFGLDCQASEALIGRRARQAEWQSWYDRGIPPLQNKGLQVNVLVNSLDDAVGDQYQCICDLKVNWHVAVAGGHSAAFWDASAVGQMFSFLRPR